MAVRTPTNRPNFWGLAQQIGPWKDTPADRNRREYRQSYANGGGKGGTTHAGHGNYEVLVNPYVVKAAKKLPKISKIISDGLVTTEDVERAPIIGRKPIKPLIGIFPPQQQKTTPYSKDVTNYRQGPSDAPGGPPPNRNPNETQDFSGGPSEDSSYPGAFTSEKSIQTEMARDDTNHIYAPSGRNPPPGGSGVSTSTDTREVARHSQTHLYADDTPPGSILRFGTPPSDIQNPTTIRNYGREIVRQINSIIRNNPAEISDAAYSTAQAIQYVINNNADMDFQSVIRHLVGNQLGNQIINNYNRLEDVTFGQALATRDFSSNQVRTHLYEIFTDYVRGNRFAFDTQLARADNSFNSHLIPTTSQLNDYITNQSQSERVTSFWLLVLQYALAIGVYSIGQIGYSGSNFKRLL